MKNNKKFLSTLSFALMFAVGLLLRLLFLPAKTVDMIGYFEWYDYISRHGIINSLGDTFSIYTPPYLYLLSLATLTKSFLPKLIAIKLIPVIFDAINFLLVYQIIKTRFENNTAPLFAASLFWLAPTVVVNSSFWGEIDSLYICFLLLCFLFFLKERPIAAIISFAITFSIKAQAVFLLPFLIILFFRKRISWLSFLLIPPTYLIMMLPAMLAGRSIASLALAYVEQGKEFSRASMNAPNLYYFLPQSAYQSSLMIGIPLAGLILLAWTLFYGLKSYPISSNILAITALVSFAFTPFLLPKMHDRYFYPADVFSLIAVFLIPEMWFVPIAYQTISMLSYLPFLFGVRSASVIPFAIFLNILTIIYLLYKQRKMVLDESEKYRVVVNKPIS